MKRVVFAFLFALLLLPLVPAPDAMADQDPILGVYDGTYTASQGVMGVTLSVFEYEGETQATFLFYPVPENPGTHRGLFQMTVSGDSDGYALYGEKWIDEYDAANYAMVNLQDVVLGDDLQVLTATVFNAETGSQAGDLTVQRRGSGDVPDALLGTYTGDYYANQGHMSLDLDVYRYYGQTFAAFHYFPAEDNPGTETGTYIMLATWDEANGQYDLQAIKWQVQSETYHFLDLSGSLDDEGAFAGSVIGKLVDDKTNEFSLTRTDGGSSDYALGSEIKVGIDGMNVPVTLSEDMVNQSTDAYHKDMAELAIALSGAAYRGGRSEGVLLHNAYRSLGFPDQNVELYSYPSDPSNNGDLPGMDDGDLAFSIASRNVGDTVLLVVVLRGTGLDTSNIPDGSLSIGDILKDVGALSDAGPFNGYVVCEGFYDFYLDVTVGMADYFHEHPSVAAAGADGRLRILFTGHSLGAAGAQVTAVSYNTHPIVEGVTGKDIFCYTFAGFNTYFDPYDVGKDGVYTDNIFNVVNRQDVIPKLPASRHYADFRSYDPLFSPSTYSIPLQKFGHVYSFSYAEGDGFDAITSAHAVTTYANAVEDDNLVTNDDPYDYVDTDDWYSGVVACPVDLQILDSSGKVLAYSEGDDDLVFDNDIVLYTNDGTKYFALPKDDEYTIRFTGTDAGTMFFGLHDGDNAIEYQDVALEDGKQLVSTIAPESGGDVELFVVDGAEEIVAVVAEDGTESPYDAAAAESVTSADIEQVADNQKTGGSDIAAPEPQQTDDGDNQGLIPENVKKALVIWVVVSAVIVLAVVAALFAVRSRRKRM